MPGLNPELRASIRLLARRCGLMLVALASLVVGIGVSAVSATVTNAVLIRPLPYDRPHDLVMIWRATDAPSPLDGFRDALLKSRQLLTPPMVLTWKQQALPVLDFAVLESWSTSSTALADFLDGESVERLRGTFATSNIFDLLGVAPALGRTFAADESDVVVISDRLWRRRYGADPAIIGRAITLAAGRFRERRSVQIIGVLPSRFHFDYPEETEVWLPLAWSTIEREFQQSLQYRAVARLRPDTPLEAAEAAFQTHRARALLTRPRKEA